MDMDFDLLSSEVKRMIRFYPREELADRIVDFVKENYETMQPDANVYATVRPADFQASEIIDLCLRYYGFRFDQMTNACRKKNWSKPGG